MRALARPRFVLLLVASALVGLGWGASYWRSFGFTYSGYDADWSRHSVWCNWSWGAWLVSYEVRDPLDLPAEERRRRSLDTRGMNWRWRPARRPAASAKPIPTMTLREAHLPGLRLQQFVRRPIPNPNDPASQNMRSVQSARVALWLVWGLVTVPLVILWAKERSREHARGFDVASGSEEEERDGTRIRVSPSTSNAPE